MLFLLIIFSSLPRYFGIGKRGGCPLECLNAKLKTSRKELSMLHTQSIRFNTSVFLVLSLVMPVLGTKRENNQEWQESFPVDKANLTDTGKNTYFILEPG